MSKEENIIADETTRDDSLPASAYGTLPRRPHEFSGIGSIGPKTAWIIAALFILCIFAPGIYQFIYDTSVLKRSQFNDLLMQRPTPASLSQFL